MFYICKTIVSILSKLIDTHNLRWRVVSTNKSNGHIWKHPSKYIKYSRVSRVILCGLPYPHTILVVFYLFNFFLLRIWYHFNFQIHFFSYQLYFLVANDIHQSIYDYLKEAPSEHDTFYQHAHIFLDEHTFHDLQCVFPQGSSHH